MVEGVRKCDGTHESFDRSKITNAIRQAFEAVGADPDVKIATAADGVVDRLDPADGTVAVETIQDHVERSARLLRDSDVECEFRTTFDPGVVPPADFGAIAELLGEEQRSIHAVRSADVLAPERVAETPDKPVETVQRAIEAERMDVTSRGYEE